MNTNGTLTVAPVSAITDKAPQAQCRFSIQAVLRGFPVTIEGEGRAGDLKIIVDRLFDLGAEPPSTVKPEPTKAAGVPVCPIHNSQMKPSQKPGAFFCPKKDESGAYCRHKA